MSKEKRFISENSKADYIAQLEIENKHLNFLLEKQKEQYLALYEELNHLKNFSEVREVYLDNIMRNISEHFYWMDRNGLMLGCNERQALGFGLKDTSDLIGKNIYEFLYSLNWSSQIIEPLRVNNIQVMRSGVTMIAEEVGFFKGEQRTFISYKSPLRNKKNETIGLFGFSVDITERKKAEEALLVAKEQAELANQAKTNFLMNMRHDLRTPFTGIISLAEILESAEISSEKKSLLQCIVQSSRAVLNILNDILNETDSGKMQEIVQYELFSFSELIFEIENLYASEISSKSLIFTVSLERIPRILVGDAARLKRILLNLISNAIKFNVPKGEIKLFAKAEILTEQSINLILSISDTGIGIAEDKLKIIFEDFTKITPSYLSDTYTGVGVGLSLTRRFIRDMEGTIDVKSVLKSGTTFTCVLPFHTPDSSNY